jgi:tetratricopeptide (TPR) repeat protein
MNRITRSLAGFLIVCPTIFTLILFAQPCAAFQFSIKTRRTPPARHSYDRHRHDRLQKAPKIAAPSHWAYRQRAPQKPPRNYGNANRNLYTTGYYSLPLFWGNQFSSRSQSALSVGTYPSNITAYDAEFRSSSRRPPIQTSLKSTPAAPTAAAAPATVTNPHFQNAPQQIINSQFQLQQRLIQSQATPLIKTTSGASNLQGHAELAFREGRYNDATYYCDQAVKADPYNGLMHLFCSQCNFAIGKYSVAILMLEKATGLLPESKWGYISRHYDTFYGKDDYVAHTRSLADYTRRRPDDNRARTLLGYHYGCLGYKTTASKLFHQSLQTYRNDELAQRLLPIFGEADYASAVVKPVQAPTPDLLDEPVAVPASVEQGYGNRTIYLTPEQTEFENSIEELPTPQEIFFEQDEAAQSVLLPALESPR